MRAPHPAVAAAGRLHELLTEQVGDQVRVDLGPLEGQTESLDLMAIGLSTEEFSVVSSVVDYPSLGFAQETFDIGCMAQSVSGDGDVLARLDRCYELMDIAAETIAGDDGEITWGRIIRHQAQWVTSGQAMTGALVLFAVGVDAHRRITTR